MYADVLCLSVVTVGRGVSPVLRLSFYLQDSPHFYPLFLFPPTLELLTDALPFLLLASYRSSLKLFGLKSPLLVGSFLVWVLFVDFSDFKRLPLPCDGFVLNLYTAININFSKVFLDQPCRGRSVRLPTLGQGARPFLYPVILKFRLSQSSNYEGWGHRFWVIHFPSFRSILFGEKILKEGSYGPPLSLIIHKWYWFWAYFINVDMNMFSNIQVSVWKF